MVYTLTEGLAALGVFGILIIANDNIYQHIKSIRLNQDIKIMGELFLYPVLGIAYLTGFLVHVIINSKFILVENLELYIILPLILNIVIVHYNIFDDLISNHLEGVTKSKVTVIVSVIWAFLLYRFIILPNGMNALWLLSIILLSIILPISPKLNEYRKKINLEILIIFLIFGIGIIILYFYLT